ncbi:hypothetical protein [Cupriavidus respiraculi]|uniref:hypothetical protein n=1 Tax=Cupriavidus respiraculi TaxID=195930 RepID=UPI001C98DEAC|nr:hypothetical protein [Cupriavidus respiraculi]MBY4947086.1 hypothetical protein [Cupriavidus respiraculi]
MAPGDRASTRIRVACPDGALTEAVVTDSWKLGEAVTLLALSAQSRRVPRLLAVVAGEGGATECRALQRAMRAGPRARPAEGAGLHRRAGR